MKILVTGGTGVIGKALVPELLKRGHTIVLLSRNAEGEAIEYPQNVEAFPADVSDPDRLRGAADGCQAVVHIAGIVEESQLTFEQVNVGGTRHMVAEAQRAGADRFIFISSLGADRGKSDYHRSKLAAEQLVQESSLKWLILRPGNVYGPGDEVISVLLKLVRTLPAIPMVGWGEQRFQPIWFEDLARAIADSVDRPALTRQILEVAGAEVTTTRELVQKLGEITDRSPVAIPLPTAIVSAVTSLAENFKSIEQLLERGGLSLPITNTKLQMLLEENFVASSSSNALQTVFNVEGLSLDSGLRRLSKELPESLPDQGVGAMERKRFRVEIEDAAWDAPTLIAEIREHITQIMPIEFRAEPDANTRVEQNETLTGEIPGRGHIQVRTIEVSDYAFTFVTVEGHPLAGTVSFRADDSEDGSLSFSIEIQARAANAVDWLAMKTVGAPMQDANWRAVVARVVDLSGGRARGEIQSVSEQLSDEEAAQVNARIEAAVKENARQQNASIS